MIVYVDICSGKVVFEGVSGKGPRGDIAIDDVTFTDGLCTTCKHLIILFYSGKVSYGTFLFCSVIFLFEKKTFSVRNDFVT